MTYPGPNDHDPLTDGELTLLLAVPRAAAATPNSTLFRLPLGPSPSMGWVDVTCSEARSIITRLAEVWKARLSQILHQSNKQASDHPVGPGLTICILVEPDFHGVFHFLAFWALGCTVQFVLSSAPGILDDQLSQSNCKVVVCSGFDDAWVAERAKYFSGTIVQLPEEEQAHQLAGREKQQASIPPPWPAPRRPTPALILQSSGTTGRPKLLRFSLYFYTIGLTYARQRYLASAATERAFENPYAQPRLLLAPFYWQSFWLSFIVNLTTATPIAFAYFKDILEVTSNQAVEWARTLSVGAIACYAGQIYHMPRAILETNSSFFQSLSSITLSGTAIDNSLSELLIRLGIRVTNLYGSSELGGLLVGAEPPYTHLRPFPHVALLVRPVTDYDFNGSRHVELWLSAATSPVLAHHLAHGGVPIKLEPFPEDGPHKGDLAVNLGDIFQELAVNSKSGSGTETVYIQIGRDSDQIRFGGSGAWADDVSATIYESQLISDINARVVAGPTGDCSWVIDGMQLFGNNMPCTALVIQLRLLEGDPRQIDSTKRPDEQFIQLIRDSIERVNNELGFQEHQRVHATKRSLIIGSNGTFAHGKGTEKLAGSYPTLSLTHKRTPKRWENVCKFKIWLDGLDFSEP